MISRFRRCVAGATAIEFAFVGPVLLLTGFGTIQLVVAIWHWNILQVVAAETARCLAVGTCVAVTSGCAASNGAVCHAVEVAQQRGYSGLLPSAVTTLDPVEINAVSFATIEIAQPYEILGMQLTLTATASFPKS